MNNWKHFDEKFELNYLNWNTKPIKLNKYIPFISDNKFITYADILYDANLDSEKKLDIYEHCNNPFKFICDNHFNEIGQAKCIKFENMRQTYLIKYNAIIAFHKSILGDVTGWNSETNNIKIKDNCDLYNDEKTVFIKFKNEYDNIHDIINNMNKIKIIHPLCKLYISEIERQSQNPQLYEIEIISGTKLYELVTGYHNTFNICVYALDMYMKEYD
jgi:hypothetical protein